MSRIEALQRNPTILFWGKALAEINVLNSVVILFYLHRGVTIDKIFYLSIVWSITALIFEVPTGYLADRFGRKRTLLLGVFLLAASWVATWFAHGFPEFVGVFILMSASYSCFSGTEEAFLYDSLKELGTERHMTTHNSRLNSADNLFNVFVPALGAWIARDLLEPQFRILIGAEIIIVIAAFIAFLLLTEPQHVQRVTEREKSIFRDSIETIRHEPFLLRATMNKLLIFIASFLAWRSSQPFLATHGITVFWLGGFYILMHGFAFIIRRYIGWVEVRMGTVRVLYTSILVMIAALTGIFITRVPWILFLLISIAILAENARSPVFAHAVNQRINSQSRATTLSNLNVFKGFLDIPILLLAGWLAKTNIEYVFVVALALCLITITALPIRRRDLAVPASGRA